MTFEEFTKMERNIKALAKVGELLRAYEKNWLRVADNLSLEAFYDVRYRNESKRRAQSMVAHEAAKLVKVYEIEQDYGAALTASCYIIDRGDMIELLDKVYDKAVTDTLMRRNQLPEEPKHHYCENEPRESV